MRYGRAFGLIAAWLLTGCHAGIDNYLVRRAAEQRFALQNTCPVDRLSIERLAVEPRELLQARAPPADVAADSERLALWNNNANEALSRFMAMSGVRVRGCGCEASYVCWDQWTAGDEAEHLSPICYEIDEAMRSSAAISGLIPRPEGWHSLRTRLEVPAR